MFALAWANLTHHQLRTLLSALAVGLGLALFLLSKGMASGSVGEVAERMRSVSAQLIVLPNQENLIFSGGAVFSQRYEQHLAGLRDENGPIARDVIPVFWASVIMGGQSQRLFGIRPEQMPLFLGHREMLEGHAFEHAEQLTRRVAELRAAGELPLVDETISAEDFDAGLELVIDSLLALGWREWAAL